MLELPVYWENKMIKYRRIRDDDNLVIAQIIRNNLERFHLDIPGTAYFDAQLDSLSTYYNEIPDQRCYFVVLNEKDGVVGGAGVAEFDGIDCCAELQKLYFVDSIKGKGYSKELFAILVDWCKEAGYKKLYLETHSNLFAAIHLYQKLGFSEIEKPKSVVHSTMDHFYVKNL